MLLHIQKEIKETYGDKTHEELEEMAVEVKVAGRNYDKASQRESVLHAYSRSRWSNPVICT